MIERSTLFGRREIIAGVGATGLSQSLLVSRADAQAGFSSVKGVYSAPGLSFAALFLADRLQLWAKNGITAEQKLVTGDNLGVVALTNKEADFASVASIGLMAAWENGIKTLAVAGLTGSLITQFTARRDWLSRVGLSVTSKLEDKLNALKGSRIGTATVAGGPAQYTRYLVRTVGMDPSEIKILPVGYASARMAALKVNQVDITIGDPPEADQIEFEGFGELFIDCAHEVPIFKEFPFTVAVVSPELASTKPDLVRRLVRTLGQANDMFNTNFGQVVDILRLQFPKVAPKALERALERCRDTFPQDCRMTDAMWKHNVEVAVATKMIAKELPYQDGQMWTNDFAS